MKKYLFILGLVGTVLFTACSTADDLAADKPIETPSDEEASVTTLIAEASQNSEVPITLGVGESRGLTRKPINPDASGNFDTPAGQYLGVFCLATGTQKVDHIPTVINYNKWDTTGEDGELIVWLKNEPAKVITSGGSCDVRFVDPSNLSLDKVHYYPMTNWMRYNFYAYYPRQGDETLSFTKNQALQTNIVINGSQDVIWGRAYPWKPSTPEEATDHDPYCAKYFRLKRAEVGEENIKNYYPRFVFEHKLVQFRFFVKAANATALTTLKGLSAKVTDMYIANAFSNLRLIVANKQDTVYNGSLSLADSSTKMLRIKKDDSDDNRFDQNGDEDVDNPLAIKVSNVDVTSYPATTFTAETAAAYNATLAGAVSAGSNAPADFATRVGYAPADENALTTAEANAFNATLAGAVAADDENGFVGYIMLPRPEVSKVVDFKYQLVVKLGYTGGSNMVAIDMDPPTGGFEEGKIYNVIVSVQSPEQIFAKAVLNAWKQWDKNGDGFINNNDVIEYLSD